MREAGPDADSWRQMVLRSMPNPAWLSPNASQTEIVLSSRRRVAANLRGFRFPSTAEPNELKEVAELIQSAVQARCEPMHKIDRMSEVERDYWVGARLISPDFAFRKPHRILYVNESRSVVLMVNEEDHLRIQSLTPGWTIDRTISESEAVVKAIRRDLEFSYWEPMGTLTASPFNCGTGHRISVMVHLLALAHLKRLPELLGALTVHNIVFRGLFGESSRAVGAFFQISTTSDQLADFRVACEYLIQQESTARAEVGTEIVAAKANDVMTHLIESRSISLADSVRALSWLRWASICQPRDWSFTPRELDGWLSGLDVHGTSESVTADRRRADFLRAKMEKRPAEAERYSRR